ncbi:hypothetical protein J6590_101886 [Homalodisca vitripennis]|nr:hypothetical protein J6590_101886 [Homalodisca vitripennis]
MVVVIPDLAVPQRFGMGESCKVRLASEVIKMFPSSITRFALRYSYITENVLKNLKLSNV